MRLHRPRHWSRPLAIRLVWPTSHKQPNINILEKYLGIMSKLTVYAILLLLRSLCCYSCKAKMTGMKINSCVEFLLVSMAEMMFSALRYSRSRTGHTTFSLMSDRPPNKTRYRWRRCVFKSRSNAFLFSIETYIGYYESECFIRIDNDNYYIIYFRNLEPIRRI